MACGEYETYSPQMSAHLKSAACMLVLSGIIVSGIFYPEPVMTTLFVFLLVTAGAPLCAALYMALLELFQE